MPEVGGSGLYRPFWGGSMCWRSSSGALRTAEHDCPAGIETVNAGTRGCAQAARLAMAAITTVRRTSREDSRIAVSRRLETQGRVQHNATSPGVRRPAEGRNGMKGFSSLLLVVAGAVAGP